MIEWLVVETCGANVGCGVLVVAYFAALVVGSALVFILGPIASWAVRHSEAEWDAHDAIERAKRP